MLESVTRSLVLRHLNAARFDAFAVENSAMPGTPDVNCIHGWIELKCISKWPVRGGNVSLDHFAPHQRAWHIKRTKAGGSCWVLLRVGSNEWLLFTGFNAARELGFVTKKRLIAIADLHCPSGMDWGEFNERIKQGNRRV